MGTNTRAEMRILALLGFYHATPSRLWVWAKAPESSIQKVFLPHIPHFNPAERAVISNMTT